MQRALVPVIGLAILLIATASAQAEKWVFPVSMKGVPFGKLEGGVMNPTSVESAAELKQVLGKALAATVDDRIDFSAYNLVMFQWQGSGHDQIDAVVANDMVTFQYKPGLTRDLRRHLEAFAVKKGVAWKVVRTKPLIAR